MGLENSEGRIVGWTVSIESGADKREESGILFAHVKFEDYYIFKCT